MEEIKKQVEADQKELMNQNKIETEQMAKIEEQDEEAFNKASLQKNRSEELRIDKEEP